MAPIYMPLESDEEKTASSQSLLGKSVLLSPSSDEFEESTSKNVGANSKNTFWIIIISLINFLILLISLILFVLVCKVQQEGRALQNRDSNLFQSPFLDKVQFSNVIKQVNGSLFDVEPHSIWRQPPSKEVDAAWNHISDSGIMAISSDQIVALGKNPGTAVKIPKDWPVDGYAAQVDVFHQIHCLNELRKQVHYDHYFKPIYGDDPPGVLHDTHIAHCIHILLQNLMCTANVDIITYEWRERQSQPFPDFNIKKQCRNFDEVLAWRERTQITEKYYDNFPIPEDAQFQPAPKAMIEYLDQERKPHNTTNSHSKEHGG